MDIRKFMNKPKASARAISDHPVPVAAGDMPDGNIRQKRRRSSAIRIDDDDDDDDDDFMMVQNIGSARSGRDVLSPRRSLRRSKRTQSRAEDEGVSDVPETPTSPSVKPRKRTLSKSLETRISDDDQVQEVVPSRQSLATRKTNKRSRPASDTDLGSKRAKPVDHAAEIDEAIHDKAEVTDSHASKSTTQAASYRKFLNRGAPPNKGQKVIPRGAPNCLEGKVFVITGILDSLERDDCTDLIKQYGGRCVSAVSKKVTHGIVGSEPGDTKLQKLKECRAKIIDEDELFDMLRMSLPSQHADHSQREDSRQMQEQKALMTSLEGENASRKGASYRKQSGTHAIEMETKGDAKLWVEKHRPSTIEDLVANPKIYEQIGAWLQTWREKHLQENASATVARPTSHGSDDDHPALLLCGPPGIGKTTAAHVICRANGYEPHEFNASDIRNKAGVAQLADSILSGACMSRYFGRSGESKGTSSSSSSRRTSKKEKKLKFSSASGHPDYPNGQAIIMDEVDGMSSGDRGGSQELLRMFKRSRVPIICICNDDSSQKMRTLSNYCYKLKFRRPMASQVRNRLLQIAKSEGFHAIDAQTAERLAEGCHGDIRQMINLLQTWRSGSASLSYEDVKSRLRNEGKTFEQLSIFEVFPSFFSQSASKNSVSDRMDLYFLDSDLMPLFVAENYLNTRAARSSGGIRAIADAAEAISEGDICSSLIRREQRWDLMPPSSVLSCVYPGAIMSGGLASRPMFPSYLGNMSKTSKLRRLVKEMEVRVKAVGTSSGSTRSFRLDYVPALMLCMATPLIRHGAAAIPDVIERLDAYYFQKDDWNSIMEMGVFKEKRGPLDAIPGAVKSALTREYNKAEHGMSTVSNAKIGSRSKPESGENALKKVASSSVAESGTVDDDGDVELEKDFDENSADQSDDDVEKFRVKAKGRGKGLKRTAPGAQTAQKSKQSARSKRR